MENRGDEGKNRPLGKILPSSEPGKGSVVKKEGEVLLGKSLPTDKRRDQSA